MAEVLRRASGVVFRVVALETPRVHRHCPGCSARRPFRSSDRFRLNARQRRVDVWLVYRCEVCESAWSCTVLSRRTPEEIGPDLPRYERNDRALAWACAFDRALLARAGARAAAEVAFRVEVVPDGDGGRADGGHAAVELVHPLELRLERVVAVGLGVGRAQVRRWAAAGALRVGDGGAGADGASALRRPARDGQRIFVAGAALAALRAASHGARAPRGDVNAAGE